MSDDHLDTISYEGTGGKVYSSEATRATEILELSQTVILEYHKDGRISGIETALIICRDHIEEYEERGMSNEANGARRCARTLERLISELK